MHCMNCGSNPIAVTVKTIVGYVSLCGACTVQCKKTEFVAELMELTDLEFSWRLDSSSVKGDGCVTA